MVSSTNGASFTKNGLDVDIKIFQGKTLSFNVVWGGSSPVDVTGFSGVLQARESSFAAETFVDFSTDNSVISVDGPAGSFQFDLPAEQSALLQAAVGTYEFEITDPSGSVFKALSGQLEIVPEVVR